MIGLMTPVLLVLIENVILVLVSTGCQRTLDAPSAPHGLGL